MRIKNPAGRIALMIITFTFLTLLTGACGDNTATVIPTTTTASLSTSPALTNTTASSPSTPLSQLTPFAVKVPANLKTGPGVDTATKTIKVGVLDPLTGPVAALGGKTSLRSVETYFKALNDAGGIGGYKIEVVSGDTQYQPQIGVQQYNKIAQDVAIIAQVYGSPVADAIKEQAEADKLLFGVSGLNSAVISYNFGFLASVPYPIETINGLDYAVNKLGKKNAKFAIVYQDDVYGQDSLKGWREAVKGLGIQDVGQVPFKSGNKDFTGQITQLKNAGAEVVWLASQPTETGLIMGAASQLGFEPQWLLQTPAWNDQLLSTPVKPVLEKALVVSFGVPWGDTSSSGEVQKLAAVAKYVPDEKPNSAFTFGWVQSIIAANIIAKALSNGDLTRDGIYNAYTSMKNIDLGGIYPNVSYGATPDERVPSRETTIFKVDPSVPGSEVAITKPFTSELAKNYKFQPSN